MIRAWNRFWWKRRRKRALRNIRREFTLWGMFVDDMSDDELEKRIVNTSRFLVRGMPHVYRLSVSIEEVAHALQKMMGVKTDDA
ncbi:hypothetical protein [Brevibacillus laterosporus]|uniref:hypothetical protein n=1 Tax=Brevibacillus laterosporus TaxID=1465 RepID=UPI0026526D70|nr:hypothetical protein [Brevibacillus laterosporus]MDN9011087.1 hypothetical protein [Brevibacillus laterosporus]MDO0942110.1 hypothetical protein [Brevibacillus laterosporus]